MTDLSDAQREAVRQWVEGGASLADVQRRLKEEFSLSLTYMEVRLLTLDVGAQVKDKPEPKKAPQPPAPEPAAAGELSDEALPDDDEGPVGTPPEPPAGESKVSVSLDRLIRPGSVVSGDVTFSDGKKARWMLDQMGRLGLEGVPADYRPAPEDVRDFQVQLQKLLASKGY